MRLRARTLLLVAGALAACNALTGVSDLSVGDCTTCDDAAVPGRGDADVVQPPPPPIDAGSPLDAPPDAPRPSYCDGILFYASFDGSLTAMGAVAPDPPAVPLTDGRYDAGVDFTQGGVLYYPFDASTTARSDGTMAMWVRTPLTAPSAGGRVFVKLKADKTTTAATGATPYAVQQPNGALLASVYVAGPGTVATPPTSLEGGAYHHIAVTWNQMTPSMTLRVNGGTPVATSAAWTPIESMINYLRLSSETSPAQGALDDVAIWHRELTAQEISELAASSRSIAEACGI